MWEVNVNKVDEVVWDNKYKGDIKYKGLVKYTGGRDIEVGGRVGGSGE